MIARIYRTEQLLLTCNETLHLVCAASRNIEMGPTKDPIPGSSTRILCPLVNVSHRIACFMPPTMTELDRTGPTLVDTSKRAKFEKPSLRYGRANAPGGPATNRTCHRFYVYIYSSFGERRLA